MQLKQNQYLLYLFSPLFELQKQEIREAFDLLDEGNGKVSANSLRIAFRGIGIDIKQEEIQQLIDQVDTNHTGMLDLNDFTKIITVKLAQRDSKEELMRAFKLFDTDNTGKISFQNLKQICQELGENLTDEEIHELIEEADRDNDGEIGQEDFIKVMKRTNLY